MWRHSEVTQYFASVGRVIDQNWSKRSRSEDNEIYWRQNNYDNHYEQGLSSKHAKKWKLYLKTVIVLSEFYIS